MNPAVHQPTSMQLLTSVQAYSACNENSSTYLARAQKLETEMRALRRDIHSNPELAYKEFETSRLAEETLRRLGFTVRNGIAGTGLIAEIGSGKNIVAIRAEMDAVEIDEFNQVIYRSRRPNVMHACGHDAHVAAVLGAAEILAQEKLPGRIRIIMQPAEETADQEGHRGSYHMIANGALDEVKAILGLHVDATMPFGRIGVIENSLLELRNSFQININSTDNKTPTGLALGRLLTQLLEQKSNNLWRNANLQVSQINWCGGEDASFTGSFCADESSNAKLCEELTKTCSSILNDHYHLTLQSNAAQIDMHKERIKQTFSAAQETLGAENVVAIRRKSWTKDFSVYANQAPASFFLLGTQLPGQRMIQHTSTFDLEEKCLPIAAAVLASSASKILSDE